MTNHTAVFEHALRSGSRDKIFYALVTHPTMPLRDAELAELVALNPVRWGPYAKYIGFLDDQASRPELAALSGLGGQLA